MNRRFFMSSLVLMGTPLWADTGHGENGVGVILQSVGPDALDPSKTAVGVNFFNESRVEVVLRSVQTNYGDATIHKTVTLFGTTTRSRVQFLAIAGRGINALRPPKRQLTIDEPYSPDKYYSFGFDFGPIGQIYAEWGEA